MNNKLGVSRGGKKARGGRRRKASTSTSLANLPQYPGHTNSVNISKKLAEGAKMSDVGHMGFSGSSLPPLS